jgi:hypothetical protein
MRIICGRGHQMYAEGRTKIASKGSYGYLVASYEVWTCLQCNTSIYKQEDTDQFISDQKIKEMIDHNKDAIIEV